MTISWAFNLGDKPISAFDECLAADHAVGMTQHDDTRVGVGVEADRGQLRSMSRNFALTAKE
jgi:hypothetical protein